MTHSIFLRLFAAFALTAMVGCQTMDPYSGEQKTSNTAKGAGIGALGGAVIGAATASKSDRGKGALIGAAAGAAVGGGVGYYMDQQEAKLRQRLQGTGVQVQRVGDTVKLIMPGNVTFDVDSAGIRGEFYPVLDSVVLVLNEFNKTLIEVKGFTDSTGSFEHNQNLSERRASSVASYLINNQVVASRIRSTGFGPRYPIASNDNPQGRAMNRRVEIDLLPM